MRHRIPTTHDGASHPLAKARTAMSVLVGLGVREVEMVDGLIYFPGFVVKVTAADKLKGGFTIWSFWNTWKHSTRHTLVLRARSGQGRYIEDSPVLVRWEDLGQLIADRQELERIKRGTP